jgi:DNA-binding beta-propeller fold protein YncE
MPDNFIIKMSMKRITKILIFSIIAIMALPVYAYDFYSDGFYYQILSKTNKTVAVTYKTDKYSGIVCDDYSGDIVIPNITTYDGNTYSVTAISDNAFWGCQKIKTLIIGDSVKNYWTSCI